MYIPYYIPLYVYILLYTIYPYYRIDVIIPHLIQCIVRYGYIITDTHISQSITV